MIVTVDHFYDTIGGGHLEFKAIAFAREQLLNKVSSQQIEHFSLGANLGQCCGGSVSLLFETIVQNQLQLDVYGAGHVAQALIPMLAGLPVSVRWIDSREELFPKQIPANVEVFIEAYPEDCVSTAKPNTANVILTHNHQLDFSLCEKILKREDASFLGVIGSKTKAKRFQMRLSHKEFTPQQISNLTCPIGLLEIKGKRPSEVAVSICAQLIGLYQTELPSPIRQGIQWKEIKNILVEEPGSMTKVEEEQ